MNSADADNFEAALAAAEAENGYTSPNPWVGAAIALRNGTRVVGHTALLAGPHAEANALSQVEDASGATLYTTLEPCAHHGRNPPCVDAIIAARVSRVVIGIEDPDARVSGNGIA